jgi:hypothetical protein
MPKSEIKDDAGNKSFLRKKHILIPVLSAIAFFVIGLSLISLGLYVNAKKQLSNANTEVAGLKQEVKGYQENPAARLVQEKAALIEEVGKLIVLPDEEPTIATVTDLASLKGQPFFASAAVGDKVLIYTNAKKAVLYRPSEKKVLEVAPVNFDSQK